jgi:transposase InsO family protein
VLVELGAVEQRYRAVLEVLGEGVSVTEVARRYGVVRQTVHGWLRRYAEDGLGGLADRSPRPASCPHQMPAPVEARIIGMRREHPGWGPSRIRWELERAGVPLPGRSAVYRALVRHGLVQARKRRRREDCRRWERPRAMDLWQMDVMGRVYLADGTEVKIVTGIDDHSRFVVCAKAVLRATARPVCQALTGALGRHGIPEQILTDNGKVFTSRFGPGRGPVLFDRVCRDNGIKHLLTKPYSPTTTGKAARLAGRCGRSSSGPRTASTRRWRSCRRRWMRGWRITTPPGRTSPAAGARQPSGSSWPAGTGLLPWPARWPRLPCRPRERSGLPGCRGG